MLKFAKNLPAKWRNLSPLLFTSNRSMHYNTEWAPTVQDDEFTYSVEDVFNAGLEHHHICNTAFPIAHTRTIKPYRVPRHRDQIALRNALSQSYGDLDQMMIYAHVPFCHTRCSFCEYTVIDPKNGGRDENVHDIYFDHMLKEFDMYSDVLDFKSKKLNGFDIGGGTPSMASTDNIHRLFDKVTNTFQPNDSKIEISIETTPNIAASEPEKINAYRRMGIDRISFGLQTTDFALAKKLGRDDANSYVEKAVENIRNAGFDSFNIDLMYGFPIRDGTVDKWPQTVLDTLNLEPDHVTLYRMRYKGTQMNHVAHRVNLEQVNKQELAARALLTESGYNGWVGKNTYSKTPDGRYGCSDYLNNRVMNGVPYIGLGLGAQSYSHNSLHYNLGAVTKKLSQYIKSVGLNRIPIQDLYYLSKVAAAAKFISVSFYFGGIDLHVFEDIFGSKLQDMYPTEVQFLLDNKLMVWAYPGDMDTNNDYPNKRLQMTQQGKKCFGGICALFYTPHIQQYLLELSGNKQDPNNIATISNSKNTHKGGVNGVNGTNKQEKYEFGNILFGGPCNQKCYFCIGKQLDPALSPNNKSTFPPKNMAHFVEKLSETNTKKVIFTGTTSDPLLYQHNVKLIELLRDSIDDVNISVHTNGELIMQRLDIINSCDSVTISYNSFNPEIFFKIHGTKQMPDLQKIIENVTIPIKLSCILTPENMHEVHDYIANCSKLGIKRIAFRHLFEVENKKEKFEHLFADLDPVGYWCNNPVYQVDGIQITHWIFENTSGQSLNLFADGTISPFYLLSDAQQLTKGDTEKQAISK